MVWYGLVWGRGAGDGHERPYHEELRDPGVRVEQLHALWGLGTGAQPDGVELL